LICVTGGETTLEALARRLHQHPPEVLQEVRLDLLRRVDGSLFQMLSGRPNTLLTCRGQAEGGGFSGPESQRRELLLRGLAAGISYLDLELSAPQELRQELFAQRGMTRMVLSLHIWQPGGLQRAAALARQPADLLKVAAAVEDAADLAALRGVLADEPRPVLRVGMGPAGLLSRALYQRFGSPWTYVVSEGAEPVAPGQLTLDRARAWRVEDASLTPLALVGGELVLSSPGPQTYNRLFVRLGLPFIYLPVVTGRPLQALELLRSLGCAGCSVTMPAKEALARDLGPARLDPDLDPRLGAVNTVLLRPDGGALGYNTDLPAVATLLRPQAGRPALVLGAGGAARAAALALQGLGSPVSVTARNARQAGALAGQLQVRAVPWERRGEEPFEVLVNATPCGAGGRGDPLPEEQDLRGRVVLDAVICAGPTPLLRRAREAGAVTIDGMQWWVEQGARQLSLLTGRPLSAAQVRQALEG
jgi:3-dehydroquinate dehydratase/shikimate dehydrogenase